MSTPTLRGPTIRNIAVVGLLATSLGGTVALAAPAPVPGHRAAFTPAAIPPAGASDPVPLAAHRALYDLSLASTHGGSTVAASGSMSFQVTDACTGWATQQQLKLQLVTREGQSTDMVSDYATLESKDGRHLTFDMQERDNGSVTQQVRGEAGIDAAGNGVIHFTLPAVSTMALPRGTLFPMAHTEAIIRAAQAGRKSIDPVLFDGTSADGPTDSYVTILGWDAAPSSSPYAVLAGESSGRVHVAFFARKPGAISPDYEIGMRYFANGVSDTLDMDFGDFTMRGSLTSFTPMTAPHRC
ncbi:cell envelope integrity EipB family protein [Lichenicola sp.]|uniref:cell envelope integrity EipB family protein n=1 Tax=Lichenicola sp. TaxID=2804529 RepID=UPI003AFFC11D